MYDDWELIQETLFNVFVLASIRGDLEQFGNSRPFAKYDFDVDEYGELSWIEVVLPEVRGRFALVRFLSHRDPFDTVQVTRLDEQEWTAGERLQVPWSTSLGVRAQLRASAGALAAADDVTPTASVIGL